MTFLLLFIAGLIYPPVMGDVLDDGMVGNYRSSGVTILNDYASCYEESRRCNYEMQVEADTPIEIYAQYKMDGASTWSDFNPTIQWTDPADYTAIQIAEFGSACAILGMYYPGASTQYKYRVEGGSESEWVAGPYIIHGNCADK